MYEQYQIKLSDEMLIRLEDAARKKSELLVTIDASHFGFVNGNGTLYRHDTVQHNIHSFIYPTPKPMIERHRPKTSDKFGYIVAADYKKTKFYDELDAQGWQLEGLNTDEYMSLCKDVLIPFSRKTPGYNGLGYVQVMGKLKHQDAIEKVLKREFLNVSIGADPKRLICSECGQDQVLQICDHFMHKGHGVFMLAEELEYEELSFVPKGADPYGKVIQIHDELKLMDAEVNVLDYDDFYGLTKNKTIVCVDNICTVCNQEEAMAKRKEEQKIVSVSYTEEFTAEKLKELKVNDEQLTDEVIETLVLSDELQDNQFAIVQKTEEGLKRRFALVDELSVKVALQLIDSAEDLTEAELTKAKKSIEKAAKKMGIEIPKCACQDSDPAEPVEGQEPAEESKEEPKEEEKTIESLTDELIAMLQSVDETKLEDSSEKPKPISFVMGAITSLATSLKWAGEDLKSSIDYYLKSLGQEAIETSAHDELKGSVQALSDELAEAKEEIDLLDEQNRELNYQIRVSLVDEIMSYKELSEDQVDEERARLTKFSYDALKEVASELRNSLGKTKGAVINNKEKQVNTIKDPTLADEQGTDVDSEGKLQDEQVEVVNLSPKQLELALQAYFRSNR